jgi:hypothetical protein
MADHEHYITPSAMEILNRYPGVFGPGPWPVRKTMLGWGFTCGEGWYPLLDRLCADIDRIRDEEGLKLEITQVKQKFGSLRVYVRGGTDRIHARLRQAEYEAQSTCEGCGGPSPGIRDRGGYLTNLCDHCRKDDLQGSGYLLAEPEVSRSTTRHVALDGAVSRSIDQRQMLMEMAGEMLSSSQVEELLGIERQEADKRRDAHRLLALWIESDWRYPAFQFREGEPISGMELILRAHAEKDPWVIVDILLAPDDTLGGRTLLQAIREGDTRALARHIAQEKGDGFV